ncbi:MAG: DUF1659 domain-containing protein [Cetobacterium sp.]
MAVTEIKDTCAMKLTFDYGRDPETKKPIRKTKSFSSVKVDASSQDIYDVGTSLASLQEDGALIKLSRVNEIIIAE